ncbi:MAG: M23 family metallopeptidase [Candidatus Omnitrophica bacterium]|nr:M23 family metallopeptidase [Candidatus Omnitrophota bacterium]
MNPDTFREIRFKLILFYVAVPASFLAAWLLFNHQSFLSPAFLNPLHSPDGKVLLRNDAGGEGHFAASRSGGRSHAGVDISAEMMAPVYASKSGRILRSFVNGGYGEFVEIIHPDLSITRYAHLSKRFVTSGQWISSDRPIGLVGKTGNAGDDNIEPHMHFEIRMDNEPVDPMQFLNQSKDSQYVD